jgi:hypothetical protein
MAQRGHRQQHSRAWPPPAEQRTRTRRLAGSGGTPGPRADRRPGRSRRHPDARRTAHRPAGSPCCQSGRRGGAGAVSITDQPFKVTLPAASRELTFWGRPVLGPEVYDAGIYENPEAFAELLAVEQSLVNEVVAAGAPYVQLDYPACTLVPDPAWSKVFRDGGVGRNALVDRSITIDNVMIENVPEAVTTGLHFCRGNIGEKFLASGSLDPVAERVFGALRYDVLLIESPQCGFSSAVGINDAEDIQWRKIDVMCRVADRV